MKSEAAERSSRERNEEDEASPGRRTRADRNVRPKALRKHLARNRARSDKKRAAEAQHLEDIEREA